MKSGAMISGSLRTTSRSSTSTLKPKDRYVRAKMIDSTGTLSAEAVLTFDQPIEHANPCEAFAADVRPSHASD